jgi:hypothetical protein
MSTVNEQIESERATLKALSELFDPDDIRFLPVNARAASAGKCSVVAYVPARVIIDRLNTVMGMAWQDSYNVLPTGEVQCQLMLRIGGEWITRTDVGCPSEQPDAGDRMKAAHSDALKRAAVKFGIGLYLYRLGNLEAGYDSAKKKITTYPALPTWAIPNDCQPAGKKMAEELVMLAKVACTRGKYDFGAWQSQSLDRYGYEANTPLADVQKRHLRRILQDVNTWIAKIAHDEAAAPCPRDGKELYVRLKAWEESLVSLKRTVNGALLAHVVAAGAKKSFPASMDTWNAAAVALAWDWAGEFAKSVVDTGKAPKPTPTAPSK